MKPSKRESLAAQSKARYLIVVKGYEQKEAAKELGFSEKTLSKWSKKLGWKEKLFKDMPQNGGVKFFVTDFLKYVKNTAPALHTDISQLLTNYLTKMDTENK